jgi:thiamine-monophosphate kinase
LAWKPLEPMEKPNAISETQLIERFSRAVATAGIRPRGLVHGVGDDAAVFRGPPGRDFVVTQDVQVENRHFRTGWFGGRELGWRLAAVNLSDVAAMGATPRYGLFSLVLPARIEPSYIDQIGRGIVSHLARFGAALVGGNVSGTGGPLTCDLTLIGECRRGGAWLRRGHPGDAIIVAGRLGEAAAGLELLRRRPAKKTARPGKAEVGGPGAGRLVRAYKRPVPLLDVVDALRGTPGIHGAIDVSDGLSTDLIRVCRASGAGCEIDASALPVSRALAAYCANRRVDPIDWIMRGGEDYALVLSAAPGRAERIRSRIETATNTPARIVGRFTARRGSYTILVDGRPRRFRATGWDHLRVR